MAMTLEAFLRKAIVFVGKGRLTRQQALGVMKFCQWLVDGSRRVGDESAG